MQDKEGVVKAVNLGTRGFPKHPLHTEMDYRIRVKIARFCETVLTVH